MKQSPVSVTGSSVSGTRATPMPPRAQVQAVRSSSTVQLTASSALASSNVARTCSSRRRASTIGTPESCAQVTSISEPTSSAGGMMASMRSVLA